MASAGAADVSCIIASEMHVIDTITDNYDQLDNVLIVHDVQ
jgi:hypothetical protein